MRLQLILPSRTTLDWEMHPEIGVLELKALCVERGWARVALLVASDGVWDMWQYDEVVDALLPTTADGPEPEPLVLGGAFAEATRARSAEYFEESADNLTGVLRMLDLT